MTKREEGMAVREEGMEVVKLRERRLHEAAVTGSVNSLNKILEKDPLILLSFKVGCFIHTPLHVAAFHGHIDFVGEILEKNPALAGVLDPRRWSPLHLASAEGHVKIVEQLIKVNPEMCISLDGDGRNPLHLAAMKDKAEVLKVLLQAEPYLANAKDGHGNTILHLAVKHKKFKTVEYLLKREEEKASKANCIAKAIRAVKEENSAKAVNAVNASGYTALDILEKSETEGPELEKIKDLFEKVSAVSAKDLIHGEWLSKKRDALMLVATLLATIAFQAAVNPPGGFWQDTSDTHRAGEAVIAYNYPDSYPFFLRANTVGFVASASTILLLITGLPFKKKFFMWILVVIMWMTITTMAYSYAFSIVAITPKKERESLSHTIAVGVIVWVSVMALLLVFHTICLVDRWLKIWCKIKKVFLKFCPCKQCSTSTVERAKV